MQHLSKDYVIQEILDIISMKQLNNEVIPDMSHNRIEDIAESILFDWNEIGDPDTNFEELVKWNIDQNITHG